MPEIKFSVAGNELSSFMDSTKRKAGEMTSDMIRNAKLQNESAREALDSLASEIKLLEKKQQLEFQLTQTALRNKRDSTVESRIAEVSAERMRNKDEFNSGAISRAEMMRRNMSLPGSNEIAQEAKDTYDDELRQKREEFRETLTQTRLMKDQIETTQRSAKDQLKQMEKGDTSIVDAVRSDDKDQLANDVASEDYKSKKKAEAESSQQESLFKSLVLFDFLQKGMQGGRAAMQSQNGFDSLSGLGDMVSAAGGGLTSTILEGAADIFLDEDNKLMKYVKRAVPLVAKAVETGIQMEFDAMQKTVESRENLFGSSGRVGAITGRNQGVFDASRYGYDYSQVAQSQLSVLGVTGNSKTLDRDTENLLTYQKGYGLDSSILLQLMELQRANSENDIDINKTLQGVLNSSYFKDGGDRSMLPIFLNNMMQVKNEMFKGADTVAPQTVSDLVNMFDKVGGQFRVLDSRSPGNISSIQSSLANPSSDNAKAMAFIALKKRHPNAGIADLIEMMQGGLNTPEYFQDMMSMVSDIGGDSNMQRMNIAGLFGFDNNMAAANLLYQGRRGLKAFKPGKSFSDDGGGTAINEALSRTSLMQQNNAEIKNSWIIGANEGMQVVADKIADAIKVGFENVEVKVTNTTTNGRTHSNIIINPTKRTK